MESNYKHLENSCKRRKCSKKVISPVAESQNPVTETKKPKIPQETAKKLYCFTHNNVTYIAVVLSTLEIHIYNQVPNLSNRFTIKLPNPSLSKKIKKIDSQGINLVLADNTYLFYIVNLITGEFLIVQRFQVTALIVLNNSCFATGDKIGQVHLWDMKGENIFVVNYKSYVDKLKAVGNDKFVLSVHLDYTIQILNVDKQKFELDNHIKQRVVDIDSNNRYVYILLLDNTVAVYEIQVKTVSYCRNIYIDGNFLSVGFLACMTKVCTHFLLNSSIMVHSFYYDKENLDLSERIKIKGENVKLSKFYNQNTVFGLKNNRVFRINLDTQQVEKSAISTNSIFDLVILDINSILTCSHSGDLNQLSFK